MCVMSMVMDHYHDEWNRKLKWNDPTGIPAYPIFPTQPLITQEEIAEFRRLLERAREYDKRNNEPDCELDEKKQKLKDLAKEMGVEISFI